MHFSRKTNYSLTLLMLILNLVLRLQASKREIGMDSFLMHILINSLSEYGSAKWFLHPLSLAGIYPYSYASSALFLISGIQQVTGLELDTIIFIYDIFLALFGIFCMYLMTGIFSDDDFFRHITVFIFSTSPALVYYTTHTIGTRPLVIILVPLVMYVLFNKTNPSKKLILICALILFLFVTHHIIYLFLPILFINIFLIIFNLKTNSFQKYFLSKHSNATFVVIPTMLFLLSFSIPFCFNRLMEMGSRYDFPFSEYIRYLGPTIIFSIASIFYLTSKTKKDFNDWVLLLSTLILAMFLYIPTYLKWFLPIFLVPMAGMGIRNCLISFNKKHKSYLLVIILLIHIIFTGYYQFLHVYELNDYDTRRIDEPSYNTGSWIEDYTTGNSISNDRILSFRIFSVSNTAHFLVPSTTIDAVHNLIDVNISMFKRYPISSDEFWFSGYEGPDVGEKTWENLNLLAISPEEFEIKYVVENVRTGGNVVWNHGSFPSQILKLAYTKNLVYDVGNISIWYI